VGTSTYAGADTAGTTTLLGIFNGITSLPKWLRGLYRKDAMDATAKTEINTGGGTFAETTDSLEAIRDTAPMGSAMRGTDGAYTGTPPSAADIKTALEIDGGKLDHLWEMTADDGGVRQYTANALELAPTGGSAPSAATVADAVWDELLAGHVIVGSAGAGVAAAGSAGDPWSTPLPGGYLAGTAGKLLADMGNSGTYSYSDTVNDGGGNLLDGVYVQCSTNSGFTNIVAATHTNAIGAFTVRSDTAGTHYLRLQLAGYSFTDQTVTLA
jgi:hypothetical protein